jgi:hypothetical protein
MCVIVKHPLAESGLEAAASRFFQDSSHKIVAGKSSMCASLFAVSPTRYMTSGMKPLIDRAVEKDIPVDTINRSSFEHQA